MSNPYSADQLDLQGLESTIKRSASWFYWIAVLSAINSLIIVFDGGMSFFVGLGVTQLIDGIAFGATQEGAPEFIKYIAMGISFAIAGCFALFALAGIKQKLPIYIFGMLLYALDALIFLAFQDWFPAGFHAFALIGLWKALPAIKEYRQLKRKLEVEETELVAEGV